MVGRILRWLPRCLVPDVHGLYNPLPMSTARACEYVGMLNPWLSYIIWQRSGTLQMKLRSLTDWLWVNQKGDYLGWAWPNQESPFNRVSDSLQLALKKQAALSSTAAGNKFCQQPHEPGREPHTSDDTLAPTDTLSRGLGYAVPRLLTHGNHDIIKGIVLSL